MSKIFDFVKPGVITGDDVQKVFEVAKANQFAMPAVNVVGTDSINAVLEAAAKAKEAVRVATRLIDRAASKGVVHSATASRLVARMGHNLSTSAKKPAAAPAK